MSPRARVLLFIVAWPVAILIGPFALTFTPGGPEPLCTHEEQVGCRFLTRSQHRSKICLVYKM